MKDLEIYFGKGYTPEEKEIIEQAIYKDIGDELFIKMLADCRFVKSVVDQHKMLHN